MHWKNSGAGHGEIEIGQLTQFIFVILLQSSGTNQRSKYMVWRWKCVNLNKTGRAQADAIKKLAKKAWKTSSFTADVCNDT